jgi:hypothetical protein
MDSISGSRFTITCANEISTTNKSKIASKIGFINSKELIVLNIQLKIMDFLKFTLKTANCIAHKVDRTMLKPTETK